MWRNSWARTGPLLYTTNGSLISVWECDRRFRATTQCGHCWMRWDTELYLGREIGFEEERIEPLRYLRIWEEDREGRTEEYRRNDARIHQSEHEPPSDVLRTRGGVQLISSYILPRSLLRIKFIYSARWNEPTMGESSFSFLCALASSHSA